MVSLNLLGGLERGGPLSPSLLIIASEVLSRGRKDLILQNKVDPYYTPVGCQAISYMAFADDTVIFATAAKTFIRCLIQLLSDYERESGHLINKKQELLCGK